MECKFEPIAIIRNDSEATVFRNNCKGEDCALYGFPASEAFYEIRHCGPDTAWNAYGISGNLVFSYALEGSQITRLNPREKFILGKLKETLFRKGLTLSGRKPNKIAIDDQGRYMTLRYAVRARHSDNDWEPIGGYASLEEARETAKWFKAPIEERLEN